MTSALPKPLRFYIAAVVVGGAAFLGLMAPSADWSPNVLGEAGLFVLLLVIAGAFPMPIAPKVKTDVSTAVLFGAVLLLEPGVAAPTAAVGIATYTLLIRFWGERLRLPWYKYPFNAGATALYVGLAALLFDSLSADRALLHIAVLPTALVGYAAGTALVTGAASLQLGVNPLRFWWMGTRENGPAEVSLLAFGFLGAVAYDESRWTILALVVPVMVIYIAFSRLARLNGQLGEALEKVGSLQGRIANTAKLASIGAMSVDMAHQIKNPLAILLGRLETLEDRIAPDNRARRHLDIATHEGWRIQELVQTFTSTAQAQWVPMEISSLVDEAYGIAGLHNRKRVRTQSSYPDGECKVGGNPVLLREAFSNIFANAMDAMKDGGRIDVAATRSEEQVVVRISDSGEGIPAEMEGHLFEPFHSTKAHGSGLGLFAAKHILELHNGNVEIESKLGKGTTVTASLPTNDSAHSKITESSEVDKLEPVLQR